MKWRVNVTQTITGDFVIEAPDHMTEAQILYALRDGGRCTAYMRNIKPSTARSVYEIDEEEGEGLEVSLYLGGAK